MAVVYARGSEFLSRGKGFDADRILSQGQGFDADRILPWGQGFDADRILSRGQGFDADRIFVLVRLPRFARFLFFLCGQIVDLATVCD